MAGVSRQPVVALLLALLACAACTATTPRAAPAPQAYVADFDRLLWLIDHDYAYRADSGCDTRRLRERLRPHALSAGSQRQVLPVLERALECLHDMHAHFNANLDSSTRLIPSGLQAWAEWQGNLAVITQVRHASAAWRAGIRRGDIIEAIGAVPTPVAIEQRFPCCVRGEAAARHARQWTLLALLAGRHDQSVDLSLSRAGVTRQVSFNPEEADPGQSNLRNVEWMRNADGSGYIAINNLGDTDTVAAFDAALSALRDTTALFLDLRNTPGGGNTGIAEPILGRFIDRRQPYQRIEPLDGKPWLREVAPRGPWQYTRPLTVLVSRWTGSMGEGMAIGLDAMQRARICGSRMAGLNGAVFDHALAASGIVVRLPGERLSHPDGTPREAFVPPLLVEDAEAGIAGDDGHAWISGSIAACRGTRN